ncbi:MAG: sulfur carrier protein ThiS [Bacteroidota bacterium]|nr:sulfur carrier protein ThiS [Bacteroidota bacterium]
MEVYCNDNQLILPENSNLIDALNQLCILQRKGLAIAVDNVMVPLQDWESFILSEHSKILIISAAQGG